MTDYLWYALGGVIGVAVGLAICWGGVWVMECRRDREWTKRHRDW